MAFSIDTKSINAASLQLSGIGNNIANSSTAGFKSSFDNQLTTAMNGVGGSPVAGNQRNFAQGNISASTGPLSMAINGNGFFQVLAQNGNPSYTRDGQFTLNNAGVIVNASGGQLSGYPANSAGQISTGNAVPLRISSAPLAPTASTRAALELNLNSGAGVPSVTTFDPTNPLSYTATSTTSVFDATGTAVNVHTFYVNNNAAGVSPSTVSVYAFVGDPVALTGSVPLGTLNFTGNTLASSTASATGSVPVTGTGVMGVFTGLAVGSGAVSLDMSNTVQWNSPFSATSTQNGSSPGELLSYQIAASGVITSTYSNGQTVNVGQVALASFQNLNGLALNAKNEFLATTASGTASINTAGSGGLGSIQGLFIEDSNVNLTNEMVNLISAQRLYQAAAEVIKIEGENMTTAIQIGG